MRIAIGTSGRFHLLDLARELHHLGNDVKLYSFLPKSRAVQFGLPGVCHMGLAQYLVPLAAWQKVAPKFHSELRDRWMSRALNRAVQARLEPCDIFIGMSGVFLAASRYARTKFAAKIVTVRGSQHVEAQDEILRNMPGSSTISDWTLKRELESYRMADRIAVPSTHVADSFRRDPLAYAKVMCNPYGVNLEMFPMLPPRRAQRGPTFVYAGIWSYQKGCDLLQECLNEITDIHLLHVGPIGDCPFPHNHPRCRHIPKVEQRDLPGVYNQADAFVLASRQDGFGVVACQALACGLPVVCTTKTGGPDIRHTETLRSRMHVVEAGDKTALANGLRYMRNRLVNGPALPPLTETDRGTLSWAGFARRYECNLQLLLEEDKSTFASA